MVISSPRTGESKMENMTKARITSIKPTVFFIRDEDGLKQRVDVSVEAEGILANVEMITRCMQWELHHPVGNVSVPREVYEIYLPDIRQEIVVEFFLLIDNKLSDQQAVTWQPERHWEIYLIPASHHDFGYTDLPSNLLREYDHILNNAVRFCVETADFPEEARFRCVIEQGWSVLHYLEHCSIEAAERLVSLLRAGRIEVTALLANEVSELCGHEEQIRLLYPVFRLKQRLGIPIRCAELNDIPGVSWGLASVLAGAGIRYFSAGIPDYYAWGEKIHALWDESEVLPRDLPGAFWWQGMDGQQVLFWFGSFNIGWGGPWSYEQAERDVPLALADLSARGYSYDLVLSRCSGGQRDNSPLDLRFSLIARQWNARWAYPRLILSTDALFFEQFERRAGLQLKMLRGELPNTDYTVGASSSAKETGINRLTHDALLAAERLAVLAALVSHQEYPAERLAEAYQSCLLYDEHTWGMAHPVGPAQDACWNQKSQWAYRAAALAHDVMSKSANCLADQVNLPDKGYFIVVFNPLARPRSDVVIIPALPPAACGKPMHWISSPAGSPNPSIWVGVTAIGRYLVNLPPTLFEKPFDLIDLTTGQRAPYQIATLTDPQAARPLAAYDYALGHTDPASVDLLNYGASQLKELIFQAENVPSMGYKTYHICPIEQAAKATPTLLRDESNVLENRFYRIVLDPNRGTVVSLYDKKLQREWVDDQAPHGLNQLVVRQPRTGETCHPVDVRINRGETGSVLASLILKSSALGCPQVTQEIVIYEDLKRIDFNNRVLRDSTPLLEVYFAFPFALQCPRIRYEASNTVIEPVRDQLPGSNTDAYAMQHWVTLSDSTGGVVWCSLEAPVVAFGELWPVSVSQAHQGILPPEFRRPFIRDSSQFWKGHLYSYALINNFRTNFQPVQVAETLFRYSLTTTGSEPSGCDFGWGVSSPFQGVCVLGPQVGSLSSSTGFCEVDPANVMLLALKGAEDGNGLIVRLAEMEGMDTPASVHLPFYEITQAFRTNLVEENRGMVWCDRHHLRIQLRPHNIVTIRCLGLSRWPAVQSYWYD
jgi:hypothetical protein